MQKLIRLTDFAKSLGLSCYVAERALERGEFENKALVRLGRVRYVARSDTFFATAIPPSRIDPEIAELVGPTP